MAESHNPETRVAWENARAGAAALGIARSELYPTLVSLAQLGVDREEIPFGTQFFRQTVPEFEVALELNYTLFDFGARRGRISAESARLLIANFAFNDVHRRIIYQVQQAYYRLLNAFGQEAAVRASLANAQTVQQAAEERLQQGLATLPDVLEARSATAQTQYELQSVLGAEEIARGDLAEALGAPVTTPIRVQPLSDVWCQTRSAIPWTRPSIARLGSVPISKRTWRVSDWRKPDGRRPEPRSFLPSISPSGPAFNRCLCSSKHCPGDIPPT